MIEYSFGLCFYSLMLPNCMFCSILSASSTHRQTRAHNIKPIFDLYGQKFRKKLFISNRMTTGWRYFLAVYYIFCFIYTKPRKNVLSSSLFADIYKQKRKSTYTYEYGPDDLESCFSLSHFVSCFLKLWLLQIDMII